MFGLGVNECEDTYLGCMAFSNKMLHLIFKVSQGNEKIYFDVVFLNWVSFSGKCRFCMFLKFKQLKLVQLKV